MLSDRHLLRQYACEASQAAFAEIVRRHVGLVYGTALRQLCGNASLAQDVTQAVFTALAAKASDAARIEHLSAWLYTTTRFTVSHTVRAERRRQDREQKALTMHAFLAETDPNCPPYIPAEVLDHALTQLDDSDREAILLRFFEGQSFAAIGAALALSEDASRMRVNRALEKIRGHFVGHGITSSAAAVTAALSGQAMAAPAHLATSISTAALAGSAAFTAAASAKLGLLSLMTSTKTIAWIASTAAVAALGYAGFQRYDSSVRDEQFATLVAARMQSETGRQAAERRAAYAEQRLADLEGKTTHPAEARPVPPLPRVATPSPSSANAARLAEKKERMARMKPLLEAGTPIKGAVVVLVDGKAVPRPVEFVIGKDTEIGDTDDGTYTFTPALNPDGSVKYLITLARKGPGTSEPIKAAVTQTPWESFTLSMGGKVVAFDPEMNAP